MRVPADLCPIATQRATMAGGACAVFLFAGKEHSIASAAPAI